MTRPQSKSSKHHSHQQHSQKSSYSNQGHQGHFAVSSPQQQHLSSSEEDVSEHENLNNDSTTKTVQPHRKVPKKEQKTGHNYNTRQKPSRESNVQSTAAQLDPTQSNHPIQSNPPIQAIQSKQQQTTTAPLLNNDQLTEEAEKFALTRYPFPPFIVRFPSPNIKEQKVAEELRKHLKDNKQIHLELIGYRRSSLKCAPNECDILLFVKDSLSFSFLYNEMNWPTTLLGSTFTKPTLPSIPPQLSLILKGVGLSIDFEDLTTELRSMFTSLENVIRLKNRFRQEITLVKLELTSPVEREKLLSTGKLCVCSISFPVEEYLAQARVLFCGKCWSIGHFRSQCRQNGETCRKCGQIVPDIKQHLSFCSQQFHCVHCKQNHASNDMKCSEVKKFRADLTHRLLNSNNNYAGTASSSGYNHDQLNFPQLPMAQRTILSNARNDQNAEIINKLDKMNEIMLKLTDKVDKLSSEFEEMKKSNEELKMQVALLAMENQTIKSIINDNKEVIKDI